MRAHGLDEIVDKYGYVTLQHNKEIDDWYVDISEKVERQSNEHISLSDGDELDETEELTNISDNDKLKAFRKELEVLLNCHSIDNDLNTPDFILAEYIIKCLTNLKITTIDRDTWFGR